MTLVGIVTTVNNGTERAVLARQWLRALGVRDDSMPVLPFSDSSSAGCQLPPGFVACDDAAAMAVGHESDTPRAVLELLCRLVGAASAIVLGSRGSDSLKWHARFHYARVDAWYAAGTALD